ncbi:MAG: heparinase II/III family protein, partial [Acidobacteriota bacterium]
YASANGWHKRDNNWNQVCNGGLGIGALAIADEEPELARAILQNARQSLPLAMRHYAPDGAGTEGATYWDYGARFNILFLASLETALGTDFELSKIDGFAQSGLYQIYMGGADRMSFDFADCGLRRLSTPMHFWMGRRFRRPEYNWFRSSELARPKQDGGFLDLLWFDASSGFDPARLPLDKYFRAAECVSMRSSWTDPNALVLAVQAGDNSNLSGHRHLDLGTFILEASGERWIIDGGVDHETYLAHQHHNPKWHYYRIRAEGHNTLVINPGADPDQDLKAVAKIVQFDSRPQRTTAVVDLTAAYAKHARGVQRTFTMENRSAVTVADRVHANAPADVWWFA